MVGIEVSSVLSAAAVSPATPSVMQPTTDFLKQALIKNYCHVEGIP